ncbi:unnamed protein product, partial [Ostreobium quekettii]
AARAKEICPGCTDVQPNDEFTCEQQAAFGKCSSEWMIDGGLCQFSCGRCGCPEKVKDEGKGGSAIVSSGREGEESVLIPAPGVVADPAPGNRPAPSEKGAPRSKAPRKAAASNAAATDTAANGDAANGTSINELAAGKDLVPIGEFGEKPGQCNGTVLKAVQASESLSTLAAAIAAAGVGPYLEDKPLNVTFFAPTDQAFERLLEEFDLSLEDLFETYREELGVALRYHIVEKSLNRSQIEELPQEQSLPTLADVPLFIGSKAAQNIEVDGFGSSATTLGDPVLICGSMVYLVDGVLLPAADLGDIVEESERDPEASDPADAACDPDAAPQTAIDADRDLSRFSEILEDADWTIKLANTTANYTVFAPTNRAIRSYEAALGAELPEDRDTLLNLVLSHVAEGGLTESELRNQTSIASINGNDINVVASGLEIELTSNGSIAIVLQVDMDESCASAVHKIDGILLPFERPANASITSTSSRNRVPTPQASANGGACDTNLWQFINNSPDLRLISQMLAFSGLVTPLQDPSLSITVFAPADHAWYSLIPEGLAFTDLIPNVRVADVMLSYHIVGAPVTSNLFENGLELPTLLHNDSRKNEALTLSLARSPSAPGGYTLVGETGRAQFEQRDVVVCGSVVHVLDAVLLPDAGLLLGEGGTKADVRDAAAGLDPKIKAGQEDAPKAPSKRRSARG